MNTMLADVDLAIRAKHIKHVPIRWSQTLSERLSVLQHAGEGAPDSIPALTNSALVMCGQAEFEVAENHALEAFRKYRQIDAASAACFESVANALFAVQRLDLAALMIRDRFAPNVEITLQIKTNGPGLGRKRWDIEASGRHVFTFDASIIQDQSEFFGLRHFISEAPMIFNYATSSKSEPGSVILNQWDVGLSPGLCYCDSRPNFFLVPDYVFVPTRGYQFARDHFHNNQVPWVERSPVAFWRGATTGICASQNDWRSLERTKLCELARRYSSSGLFDVGYSGIVQFPDPATMSEIRESGLVLGRVPWESWNRYKFLVDIDGNSSPWSNLFQRLLTGSTVLKVTSYRGLRQWFYDDLKDWENYVPIAPDLSDLVDKVKWLNRNDTVAQRIGARGRELALRLEYETELARSIPVIHAAFRAHVDETEDADTLVPAILPSRDVMSSKKPGAEDVEAICQLLRDMDFHVGEYISQYKDLAHMSTSLRDLVSHLLSHGAKEGRKIPVRDPTSLKQALESLKLTSSAASAMSVAAKNALVSTRYCVERYLEQPGPRRLEIGAGSTVRPGWLSTDLNAQVKPDGSFVIALDAQKVFPIPSDVFDTIYSEHMLEHIGFDEGLVMLRECFRVLKPGGILRIATPSIGMLLRVMAPDRSLLEQQYFQQTMKASFPNAPAHTYAFFLNNFMRNWGHKFVYDRETLELALKISGFKSIRECQFGQSAEPALCNLEHAARMPPGFLELETMIFEAIKHAAGEAGRQP